MNTVDTLRDTCYMYINPVSLMVSIPCHHTTVAQGVYRPLVPVHEAVVLDLQDGVW